MKNLMRNVFLLWSLLALPLLVTADEIKIVALGASQTNGKGYLTLMHIPLSSKES
jgi:hypothetical protein